MTPVGLIDNEPLEQPIQEEFRAGTITLSWDADDERVVIEVFPVAEVEVELPVEAAEQELIDLPIEEPEPEEVLLVRMPPAMARAFATRAESVVAAGRAPCPFCGGPLDPDGHLCPRANGYRRRDPRAVTAMAAPAPSTLLDGRAGRARPDHARLQPHLPRPGSATRACSASTSRLGGAAAVGLHRRHAGRPRVRRLGGLRRTSAGTSSRRRCCATAPPAPGWCSCGWSPRSPDGGPDPVDVVPEGELPPGYLHVLDAHRRPATSRSRWCTRTPSRCAGWRSSTSSPTTPTARAATCCRCPTGTATASTTGSASTSRTSCAPCCGAGPASGSSTAERAGVEARPRRPGRGDLRDALEDLLTVREVDADRPALRAAAARRDVPGAGGRLALDPVAALLRRRPIGSAACVRGPLPTRDPPRGARTGGPGPRQLARALRDVTPPGRPGPDVRLRDHAVRRHPPGPRRDVRRLRPAQPRLALGRPRRALRAERHRRRRPAARARRRHRAGLGRARRARDRAVPHRHGGAARAAARRTTSAPSRRSR